MSQQHQKQINNLKEEIKYREDMINTQKKVIELLERRIKDLEVRE